MKKNINAYFDTLKSLVGSIEADNSSGASCCFDDAIDASIRMVLDTARSGGKLILIGNGASASIASHMATDFLKNCGVKAIAFSDSSLLTCLSNDLGYKYVFAKPTGMFAEENDILIAVSSSGKSENILKGVSAAKEKGSKVITLSGFGADNPLKKMGDVNFYVPSSEYGFVETIHTSICHCIADFVKDNTLDQSSTSTAGVIN
ncbi:SIS domain-containing protein [Candidatus Omnitrophota bacterium]